MGRGYIGLSALGHGGWSLTQADGLGWYISRLWRLQETPCLRPMLVHLLFAIFREFFPLSSLECKLCYSAQRDICDDERGPKARFGVNYDRLCPAFLNKFAESPVQCQSPE